MQFRVLIFTFTFLLFASCNSNKERRAALLEQKKRDSLLATQAIDVSFGRSPIRENAKEIIENWPELNKFDGFIQSYFSQKRGDINQGINELTQAIDSLYTSKIPDDAQIPQIKSRINLLRNYIYKFQDQLIDEPVSDTLYKENIIEIKKAYNALYIQLNRINFFKPNPELLDTIE